MLNEMYKNGITEVLTILKYNDLKYSEKIPKKLMRFFEENSSKNYKPNISPTQELIEMDLLPETKGLLSILYINYWADSEKKKEEFKSILNENQKKYDKKIREKYNPDKIFNNQVQEVNTIIKNNKDNFRVKDDEALVESKENFIKKIFNKIKSFIKNFFKNE